MAPNLPEGFKDEDLCFMLSCWKGEVDGSSLNPADNHLWNTLQLTCGVLIRMRSALFRVYRRSECRIIRDNNLIPDQFYYLVHFVIYEKEKLTSWNKDTLWEISEELGFKSTNLCLSLNKEFFAHPLLPPHPATGRLYFRRSLLQRIQEYHNTIQRPEGTFSEEINPQLDALSKLERSLCRVCNGRRQLYCGPCGGLRLEATEGLLPPRVTLPFDVCLLLHWNESLVKCTGIHAAVLGEEGQTTYRLWEKEEDQSTSIVSSLDHEKDVLLFPYPDSTPADVFPWHEQRWRLLVLEASWGYAKAMSQQIVNYRKQHNLPPLRSVSLHNVVGQYWRFQSEGHSAVSTIEAIAHTARTAGSTEQDENDLLTLFKVQKHRVLGNLKVGAKVPRAMEVSGAGTGSWKEVEVLDDEESS